MSDAREVKVSEAMRSLAALLTAAERGTEIVITRAGKPVARLVPPDRRDAPTTEAPKRGLRSRGFRDHS